MVGQLALGAPALFEFAGELIVEPRQALAPLDECRFARIDFLGHGVEGDRKFADLVVAADVEIVVEAA